MIRPTFYGLEIAKTGLYMSQMGMDVTAHNISNVDTPGYTRQRLVQQSIDPYGAIYRLKPLKTYSVGGGVDLVRIDQIRNEFLDTQFRNEQSKYSSWATRAQGLGYIESLYDELGSGGLLRSSITGLFDAFAELSRNSSDREPREVARQAALTMIDSLQQTYNSLVEQRDMQNMAIDQTVKEINNILDQIGSLNHIIHSYERDGNLQANDLRDKRNLLLDQLSALVDFSYTEKNGYVDITIGGVKVLDGTTVTKIDCVADPATGDYQLAIDTGKIFGELNYDPSYIPGVSPPDPAKDAAAAAVDALARTAAGANYDAGYDNTLTDTDIGYNPDKAAAADAYAAFMTDYNAKVGSPITVTLDASNVTGGELGGHLSLRDGTDPTNPGIPYFMEQLNRLAAAIVAEVNAIHEGGWSFPGQEGNVSLDSQTGLKFFADFTDISSMSLSKEILESVWNIACSSEEIDLSDPENAKGGNNLNALKLYELLESATITDIGSINGFFISMVTEVASAINRANNLADAYGTNTLNIDNNRTSICGVSLDEEMTNMLKYQHSYDACARIITAMDEMLDQLINRMGLVGRS